MLSSAHRLRHSADFRATTRGGRRAATRLLVAHGRATPAGSASSQVGFVVGKKVGNAVVRNQVKRRLRHLVAERIDQVPARLVVRALPAAAGVSSRELGADLDVALNRLAGG